MTYRTALAGYSDVVAGRLPAGGSLNGQQATVQAAVTTATAARFGLRVGDQLTAGAVTVVITGIIRPANPAATFWSQGFSTAPVLTPGGSSHLPYWTGAVFVGPGALPFIEADLNTNEMIVTWEYATALTRLTAGRAGGLAASVGGLVSSGATLAVPGFHVPVVVSVASPVPAILSPFIAGESAVTPVLELLYVSLAVTRGGGGAARRPAGRASAVHAEFTLMRARGAALYQLGWLALRSSAGHRRGRRERRRPRSPSGLTVGDGDVRWAGGWPAVTVAVTLVGPVLISVVPQRVARSDTGWTGGGRGARRPAAAGPGAVDLSPGASSSRRRWSPSAVGGLVVLRSAGPRPPRAASLYPSAAPVLVGDPRGGPRAALLPRRWPASWPGSRAGPAGWSRSSAWPGPPARSPGAALPAFALVLVLAMVAFPAMVAAAVTRGQVAASWRQVGADAIVRGPGRRRVISPALQRQIAAVPGVDAHDRREWSSGGSLPVNGSELTAVFVDPASVCGRGRPGPRAVVPRWPRSPGTGGSSQAAVIPAVATASGRPADRQHHPRYAAAAGPQAHPAGATAAARSRSASTVADGATTT